MKLTKFPKLKKAIEALDTQAVAKKLRHLEEQLQRRGMPLDPQNTAITQDGIFYIEPESGIATKVVLYVADFVTTLTKAQKRNLAPEGYTDSRSIVKFSTYHLMRCNTLNLSERTGWTDPYRISKRTDGRFFYRVVSPVDPETGDKELYQEIERQRLYLCSYCLWKVTSLLPRAQGATQESFDLKLFFDVNLMQSWNSHGLLSKDHGFTKDMYPDDWIEICRIRMEQVNYQCECCFEDLSPHALRRFLFINPTDHIEGREGFVKLDSLCVVCLADIYGIEDAKQLPAIQEYYRAREQLSRPRDWFDDEDQRPRA